VGVKFVPSAEVKNTEWGRLWTGCWGTRWQKAGENCMMGSLILCTLCQMLLGWSNQGGAMGGVCSTHGEDEMHTQFSLESVKGWAQSEDLGAGGKIIVKWILRRQGEDVEWIYLVHNKGLWRILVNFPVSGRWWISWVFEQQLVSQGVLCSVNFVVW
jgi:hypothetical protein